MIENIKIVDGHIHTFSSDEIAKKIITSFNKVYDIHFENTGTGTVNDILEKMRNNGIDYSVTANFAPPKIIHNNNLWNLQEGKNHPELVPLVSFHPEMEGSFDKILDSYINEGAKGIKIHPMAQGFDPNDNRLEPLYKRCNELSFPIVFHCGRVSNARLNSYSDIDVLLHVISRYPDIPFVLTHMADGNVEDVLNVSRQYNNVYFDTSIVITGYDALAKVNEPSWLDDKIVIDVVNAIGADRLLFGSDYPWGSPSDDLKRFLKMDLTPEQKKKILGLNAIKLFKIE